MRAHFQLGLYRGTSIVSRLIRWQTRSCYSHVAGRCPETGKVIEAWHRPFPGGVFCRDSWFDAHRPETRVDVFTVPAMTRSVSRDLWSLAERKVGKGHYDYRAIARFLSRRSAPADGSWFCAEVWASVFEDVEHPLLARVPPGHVSPAMLSWSPLLKYVHSVCKHRAGNVVSFVDKALLAVALVVAVTGCRAAGPAVRLERCNHVTVEIHGTTTDAQQGKTVPVDIARQAKVSGLPGN